MKLFNSKQSSNGPILKSIFVLILGQSSCQETKTRQPIFRRYLPDNSEPGQFIDGEHVWHRGGVYSEASTTFPLDGESMSLNGLSNLQSSAFSFPAPISQSADAFLTLQGAQASKHGHALATLAPQKLTLEKYREKHAAELEQKRRHEEVESDQHRKHRHLSSEPSTSIRVKYSQQQVPERSLKSGSLKRRTLPRRKTVLLVKKSWKWRSSFVWK